MSLNGASYDDNLLVRRQAQIDRDDQYESRVDAKKAELLGSAPNDFDIFIDLENQIIHGSESSEKYQRAIQKAMLACPELFECFEEAAGIEARDIIARQNMSNSILEAVSHSIR